MASPTRSPTPGCSWPATTHPTSTARPSPSTAGFPPRTPWCAASGDRPRVIYLVRHGQTEFNRERRIQGHVDTPLTALGRAHATAQIVAGKLGGLPVELDERLKEMSWGAHDGRLRSELEAEHPETFGKTGWAFDAATGESYDDVAARVGAWLADLPPEPERKVIAVAHGISGRVLRG